MDRVLDIDSFTLMVNYCIFIDSYIVINRVIVILKKKNKCQRKLESEFMGHLFNREKDFFWLCDKRDKRDKRGLVEPA